MFSTWFSICFVSNRKSEDLGKIVVMGTMAMILIITASEALVGKIMEPNGINIIF